MTRTKLTRTLALTFALSPLLAAGSAGAETTGLARRLRDNPVLPQGFAVQAGGGVTGFTGSEARDHLGTGAMFEARAIFGTRSYLGGELAYVGSGSEVSASGLDGNAIMLSNGLEMTGRYSLPLYYRDLRLAPFLFSGMGYSRLSIVNDTGNASIAKGGANALTMPFGAGFNTGWNGFTADLRFTYRKVIDDDMIKTPGQDRVNLANWSAGLTVGYEL